MGNRLKRCGGAVVFNKSSNGVNKRICTRCGYGYSSRKRANCTRIIG